MIAFLINVSLRFHSDASHSFGNCFSSHISVSPSKSHPAMREKFDCPSPPPAGRRSPHQSCNGCQSRRHLHRPKRQGGRSEGGDAEEAAGDLAMAAVSGAKGGGGIAGGGRTGVVFHLRGARGRARLGYVS